ncbi:hypothetical protein DFH29DRAFT_797049, partial [Suillus ampliporus]
MSNPPSISKASPSLALPSESTSSTSCGKQASSQLYDVPSLENDGSNFQMWKYRVMMILDVWGLWEIVDGSEKKP